MKAIKFLKAVFMPAIDDLAEIKDDLENLQKEMEEISMMDNKVKAIVRLFRVVSPIQDKGGFSKTILKLEEKNYGQLDQLISSLKALQLHFKDAGRDKFGINRTEIGEEVTPEKVFLGDVFDIWTKPASYWLEKEEQLKKEHRPDVSKNLQNIVSVWYLINDYQAGSFVDFHTKGILHQTSIILKKLE